MNQTTNYALPQWEATDAVKRSDFNDAMSKIDAAMADKLDAGALDSSIGRLKVVWGAYMGKGTYGSGKETMLTFDKTPIALLVGGAGYMLFLIRTAATAFSFCEGKYPQPVTTGWTNSYAYWYSNTSAENQLNKLQQTYCYVAILLDN